VVGCPSQVQRHGQAGTVVPRRGLVAESGSKCGEVFWAPACRLGHCDLDCSEGVPVAGHPGLAVVGQGPPGVVGSSADTRLARAVHPGRLGEQPTLGPTFGVLIEGCSREAGLVAVGDCRAVAAVGGARDILTEVPHRSRTGIQ